MKKKKYELINDEVFVTFHYMPYIYKNIKYMAVKCKDYKDAESVVYDVNSVQGAKFVSVNKSGILREDCEVISSDEYFKQFA